MPPEPVVLKKPALDPPDAVDAPPPTFNPFQWSKVDLLRWGSILGNIVFGWNVGTVRSVPPRAMNLLYRTQTVGRNQRGSRPENAWTADAPGAPPAPDPFVAYVDSLLQSVIGNNAAHRARYTQKNQFRKLNIE
ncbi:uncharacterized protein SPPG_03710 [Spizellomyces punctatus DAOM BR117]|uniref:Uncharacterized protein n=1 Tax=Spizellomyces punctatus (strain DAOM BR117) TaxID=645134 RepID=A0A0L0HGL6_SPIPD|nr:uncharacterized protein SPPG_03710 [Spizellomyces punctatus DAOM BR117]KND00586.1 hypothetical protein SPPG_03710 [Spizellomyces punctatus DAOM BR117]|eukprot:XP_016608625.1 hypothetical protein SPPG_03710 [Spizellomyces punctatus DAOM BR117]